MWPFAKLRDAVEFVSTGPFGSLLHSDDYVEGGIPLVNPSNIVDGIIVPDSTKTLDVATLARLQSYVLAEGDVVVARRGELGRCAVVRADQQGWLCGTGSFFVRPSKRLMPEFLALLLSSPEYRSILGKASTGATMPNISNATLQNLLIPLPPLHEQKIIVAVLYEALDAISVATTNTEKNLANVRELFESLYDQLFVAQEAWSIQNLGDVAEFKNGLNFTLSSKGETIKIVGVKDFQSNLSVPKDGLANVQIGGALSNDYVLRPDDILTVRSNGNRQLIGRCMIVRDVPDRCSHSGFTIRIRLTTDRIDPEFLVRLLKTRAIRSALVASGDGANISSLNQSALSALLIAYPDLPAQREITERSGRLEMERASLARVHHNRLDALEALKQSILSRAFSGQLSSIRGLAA